MRPLRGGRRLFFGSFVPLFLLCLVWAFTMPKFAGDEEIEHTVHAASVFTQGPFGTKTIDSFANKREIIFEDKAPISADSWYVTVPRGFELVVDQLCYLANPHDTPDCAPELPFKAGEIETHTPVGGYPPLWAFFSGLAGVLFPPVTSLFLTRIMHSAVVALFLTLGARALWRVHGVTMLPPFIALLAPSVFIVGSGATPVGIMIAGAVAFWANASSFAQYGWRLEGRMMVYLSFATALTTPFAPLFVAALTILALIHAVPSHEWRKRLTNSSYTFPFIGSISAALTGLAWNIMVGSYTIPFPTQPLGNVTDQTVLQQAFLHVPSRLNSLFSTLSNQAIHVPLIPLLLWAVAMVAVIGVGFIYGNPTEQNIIVLLVLATILTPVAIDMVSAKESGIAWSGTYMWPLFAAAVLLSIDIYAKLNLDGIRYVLVALWVIPIIPMHIGTWVWAMFRFAKGSQGSPWAWHDSAIWLPPFNDKTLMLLLVLVASYAVVTATLTLWPEVFIKWNKRPLPTTKK